MILVTHCRARGRWRSPTKLRVFDAGKVDASVEIQFEVEAEIGLREENLALFQQVWGIYNRHYYDPFFHGVDWGAMRAKYAPAAASSRTKPEIHGLINDLIDELQSSHVTLEPKRPANDVQTGMIGADLELLDDGTLRVVRVVEGGPAAQAGIEAGGVIVAVGQEDLKPGVNFDRLMSVAGDAELGDVGIAVKDDEGNIRTRYVRPLPVKAMRKLKFGAQNERRRKFVRERGGGRLAYGRLRFMSPAETNRMRKEVEKDLPGVEGLVLDVRDGVGGMAHRETIRWLNPAAADRLDKNPVCYMRNRNGSGGPDHFRKRPKWDPWDRPVVVIQNTVSRSDKEIFSYTFRAGGLGYTVGQPTAGGVIGGNSRRVRDGSSIMVSVQGWFTADGRNMEGWGVPPDFLVPETHADLRAGRDAQLEKAIEILLAQLDGTLPPPSSGPLPKK
jgi:tricorn protease